MKHDPKTTEPLQPLTRSCSALRSRDSRDSDAHHRPLGWHRPCQCACNSPLRHLGRTPVLERARNPSRMPAETAGNAPVRARPRPGLSGQGRLLTGGWPAGSRGVYMVQLTGSHPRRCGRSHGGIRHGHWPRQGCSGTACALFSGRDPCRERASMRHSRLAAYDSRWVPLRVGTGVRAGRYPCWRASCAAADGPHGNWDAMVAAPFAFRVCYCAEAAGGACRGTRGATFTLRGRGHCF